MKLFISFSGNRKQKSFQHRHSGVLEKQLQPF